MTLYQHRPRFVIYADWHSYVNSAPLDQEIRRKFPSAIIERVGRGDLLDPALYKNLDAFILPGIDGEDSLYPVHVSPANDLIRAYVANGGTYLGLCAGAYYAAQSIQYQPDWRSHKSEDQNLLGLFQGVAMGPPAGLHTRSEHDVHFKGLRATRLKAEALAQMIETPIIYSSGPTFIPDAGQDFKIHARYADAQGEPPAIISFMYGQGLVILSGPLPQYAGRPHSGLPGHEKLAAILDVMTAHEPARNLIFTSLMHNIMAQSRKTGLIPAAAL